MNRIFLFVFLLLLSSLTAYPEVVNEGLQGTAVWRAGVSSIVITPQNSMWMAGYASRDRPSEGTIHDLWAKALAFEDTKGNRSVLVTCDLVGIQKSMSDRIRDRLQSRYNLSRAQIILNSSHTHSGPVLMSDPIDESQTSGGYGIIHIYRLDLQQVSLIRTYSKWLEDKIVALVGKAFESMQPVRIYAENGVTRFQVNRRNNPEQLLNRQTDLNGPNDYAVPVIKVESVTGDLVAIAFGYACHNTVLGGLQWSGDYAGFAQLALQQMYPGTTALFFQGAGGDQNPLPRRKIALAKKYGHELAEAVRAVITEPMRELAPQLTTAYAEIDLEYANPLPDKEELLKIRDGDSDYPEYRRSSAEVLLAQINKGKALRASYPFPVQIWKLGEQSIFALGGELVIDYAIQLKRIFGDDSFVLGYSNDVMGYIPSARIMVEGGYEASRTPIFTTSWHPNTETKIIHALVKMAREMGVEE